MREENIVGYEKNLISSTKLFTIMLLTTIIYVLFSNFYIYTFLFYNSNRTYLFNGPILNFDPTHTSDSDSKYIIIIKRMTLV